MRTVISGTRTTALVLAALVLAALVLAARAAAAHEPHRCAPGYPDAPALAGHVEHADIVAGRLPFGPLIAAGRALFTAMVNVCDGQGRPAATGTGDTRAPDEPAFSRTSAPDSSACAGCHNAPRAGGAGDFVANVFVLAQARDPVTFSLAPADSNERNTPGMFGAGAIEMLAREMSAGLRSQAAVLPDGTHVLTAKGVEFEVTITGGAVVASRGVDTDLLIKPFHQAGVARSIREFTVNAYNHHHGMQAEERFDRNPAKGFERDHDGDGVERELTIGDITAVTVFQAALGVPGRVLPVDPEARRAVDRGERVFAEVGCTSCHKPALTLDSPLFVEPHPLNPPGTFSDQTQAVSFDLTEDGERPRLEKAPGGGAIVRAYTDLKRHNLCDEEIRVLCNERLAQDRPDQDDRPGAEFFITRKLWDCGNSGPFGHRGDLTTVTDAILAHGGEARTARDAFVARPFDDQAAVVKFLKTLQVLPPGSPRIVIAHRGLNLTLGPTSAR